MKTEELAEIVTKSKQGDEDAFNKLYQNYVKKVYYVCLSFLKDKEDALDVTQDTFVTAFEKLSTLQNPESFGMWINQIATNKCKNILIKKSRTFVEELKMDNQGIEDEDLNTEFIPEEYVLNKEKRKVIMEIIDNKLSDVQRMVILLYYYEGEFVSEIAKILECSEGTVKSRLNSARKVIKKAIEDKEKKGFPVLGIVAYFALSSIVEAEASEIILPSELMVTGSKFIAKNKVINSGNVKMAKKGIMFKVAGIGVGVLAVAGIAIAVAISGGDDKSNKKLDREESVKTEESSSEDFEENLDYETEESETKKDVNKLDIEIKDEEYEHDINYICEDGIDNGTFSFLLSQPGDEDLRIGSYVFKDLNNYNPITSSLEMYGFYNYVTGPTGRSISYSNSYNLCKMISIYDDIWDGEESTGQSCIKISYGGYLNGSLEMSYIESFRDDKTLEIYQEGDYFVHASKSSSDEVYYEIYYGIQDEFFIEISIHTYEHEINKVLIKEITDNLSFEYCSSDSATEVKGKSLAEDKLAQIVEKDYAIYLKNPLNIKEMEYDKIIYTYDEDEYTLLWELGLVESSWQLITEYEDYDVYFDEERFRYIFAEKSGNYLIKIWGSALDDLDASEGYDLVRKVFLK